MVHRRAVPTFQIFLQVYLTYWTVENSYPQIGEGILGKLGEWLEKEGNNHHSIERKKDYTDRPS